MNDIRNIILDLDGTLTDSKEGITKCIQFALSELGKEIPHADALQWCIGPALSITFRRILETSDEVLITQAIAYYRVRFADVGMFENSVYPGVLDMLEKIKAHKLRTFVATSKPEVFAVKILDHFHLSAFFESIHGSGLDGTRSDKGELLAYVLEKENLDPKMTLMIGDREHDILGAKKNRIWTGAVTYGYGSTEEITATQPDAIFHHPREVLTLLKIA